ncbi:MAG: sigma-70 family RNA polymerase sigma factor [Deltaproteobacteria bacterium]|nr:sigma-70 family RNA polymerase sigma factor [Deltaproteobacteria bacterium]
MACSEAGGSRTSIEVTGALLAPAAADCPARVRPTPSVEALRAAAGGDPADCREVYTWLLGVVPRMIRRCGVGVAVPGDLVHDIAADATLGLRHFRGDAGFATWVFQIVKHRVADCCKRRGRGELVLDDAPAVVIADVRPSPDQQVDTVARLCCVSTAVQLVVILHPRPVVCWLALTIWGRSASDVAEELGLTIDTVYQDVHRGAIMIHEALRWVQPSRRRKPHVLAGGCPFTDLRATYAWCTAVPPTCLTPWGLHRGSARRFVAPFLSGTPPPPPPPEPRFPWP